MLESDVPEHTPLGVLLKFIQRLVHSSVRSLVLAPWYPNVSDSAYILKLRLQIARLLDEVSVYNFFTYIGFNLVYSQSTFWETVLPVAAVKPLIRHL